LHESAGQLTPANEALLTDLYLAIYSAKNSYCMHWFRDFAAARGVASLLAILVWVGPAEWGHSAWDDPACDPVPVHHDHAAHRVADGTRGIPSDSDHCYLCHLQRLLHAGIAARCGRPSQIAASSRYLIGTSDLASRCLDLAVSPRAPPATLS
jgi:hypothetical protein